MKSRKLLIPALILVLAVLLITGCSLFTSIAKKPVITEEDFAFSVTYELNGESKTFSDVLNVRYVYNSGYVDTKERVYVEVLESIGLENNTWIVLQDDENGRILLVTGLCRDCLMGDKQCGCISDEPFEPRLVYEDPLGIDTDEESALQALGAKIISWKYPEPIENTFVFSHFSILSCEAVIPSLLIGILALIATFIFVKREQGIERKTLDIASAIVNFLLGVTVVPFFAVAMLIADVLGDNDSLSHQMLYFSSAFSVLCIAASVVLRRRGYSKTGFVIQFVGPALFFILLFFNTSGIF